MARNNKLNNQEGYFDDCPICQAMKKMGVKMEQHNDEAEENGIFEPGYSSAKLTQAQLVALKKSFKAAKDKEAIVGGEWFNDK